MYNVKNIQSIHMLAMIASYFVDATFSFEEICQSSAFNSIMLKEVQI